MIVVEGKIRGKARPRFNTKSGQAFTPKETISYENWVRYNYKTQSDKYFDGPIKAEIEVYYAIPKSYSKSRRQKIINGEELPAKKPDADNIAKIVLDSLNKIAFDDDAQVVELIIIKKYTQGLERIEFKLEELNK